MTFGATMTETSSLQETQYLVRRSRLEHALAERRALAIALLNIIRVAEDFRKNMPDDWEGDPLQDACDRARILLGAAP